MIPVYQTLTTLNDGRGNCFMACVASIMELPLRDVPAIASDLKGGDFFRALEDWLIPQGLFINRHECSCAAKGWSIRSGTLHGTGHVVVAWNGDLAHDPYPLSTKYGGFVPSFEWWTIDPISEEQRPYCDERLSAVTV